MRREPLSRCYRRKFRSPGMVPRARPWSFLYNEQVERRALAHWRLPAGSAGSSLALRGTINCGASCFSWAEFSRFDLSKGLITEMPQYAPYTTTVVGAHSVPRWYEVLDRLVSLGQLAEGDFADAQLRATQAAILEQEIAGVDVITGGEMHRRRHNRHAPPNAMLNHFWQKIPSFQGENSTQIDHSIRP